ncbi:MAG TPA: hypothetical protein PKC69_02000 [Chitinophagaceae bacterium]|nr:hypothetical protein [Chitinophagaceae bacterium]
MKKLLLLLAISCSLLLQAQKGDTFLENYKNSRGTYYNYWGPVKNGVPEGKGIAALNFSGKYAFYIGDFKNGLREGKGMMHWSSGYRYEGVWAGDTIGTGIAKYFINSSGAYYEGGMAGQKYTGQGIFYFGDGRMVTGEFKNGLQNGYCIYRQRDGGVYEGYFKDGKYDGEGIHTDSAGVKREGIWKAGVFESEQKVSKPARLPEKKLPGDPYLFSYKNDKGNIFSYRGPVKNQAPDGIGMGIYYYGTSKYALYKGGYKNGSRHGKGEMYFHTGDFFTGEWANDSLKNGAYYFGNGNRYEGAFAGNKREGKGKFYFLAGSVYDGDFKDAKYDGKGTYTAKDFTYTGEFRDDKYQGKGKMVKGSEIKDGDWEANVFKGTVQYVLPKGVKAFAGTDNWAKDKTKEEILSLFRSYNNSKLASAKGSAWGKNGKGQERFQSKIKLTGADTLFVVKDTTMIYLAPMGAIASGADADEAFRKMEGWLTSFLSRDYTTHSYTYTIHGLYAYKSAVFTDKEKKASICLYLQKEGGIYHVNLAMSKKELVSTYYDDEDDDDWWF